jgi:hypothetical protein
MSDNVRTEYTIKVTEPDGREWYLEPMLGGGLEITMQRLDDLETPHIGRPEQSYSLARRQVTITDWEDA